MDTEFSFVVSGEIDENKNELKVKINLLEELKVGIWRLCIKTLVCDEIKPTTSEGIAHYVSCNYCLQEIVFNGKALYRSTEEKCLFTFKPSEKCVDNRGDFFLFDSACCRDEDLIFSIRVAKTKSKIKSGKFSLHVILRKLED